MNKLKVNGICLRLTRIQRELYSLAAEFGDVDNHFMTELEKASDEAGRIRAEIADMKNELAQ